MTDGYFDYEQAQEAVDDIDPETAHRIPSPVPVVPTSRRDIPWCNEGDAWIVHPTSLNIHELGQRTYEDVRNEYTSYQDVLNKEPTYQALLILRDNDQGTFDDDIRLVLNAVDEFNVHWGITDIQGWWTTPEPNIPDQPRGWGDGSYFDTGRYEARAFTIEGVYQPLDMAPGVAAAARDRLIRACNLVRKQGLFVTRDWDDTKFTVIELGAAPMINTLDESGRTEFSLQFRAPDPRKFSTTIHRVNYYGDLTNKPSNSTYGDVLLAFMPEYSTIPSPAGPYHTYQELLDYGASKSTHTFVGSVTTKGNYRADLVLEFEAVDRPSTSTTDPITITNLVTGQKVKIIKNPAGDRLVIDTTQRDVKVGTRWGRRDMLSLDSDWLVIDEGLNIFKIEPNIAQGTSAQVTFIYRDTWIG